MKNLNQTARLGYWAKMIYELLTRKQKWKVKNPNANGMKTLLLSTSPPQPSLN